MKSFFWIAGIIVAIVVLSLIGKGGSSIEPPFELGVPHPLDNMKGLPDNASSTVVLMEYSDFQCPACRSYYPVLRQVMTEFGDRITFVFRHFPLSSIHMNAEFAARAAEAAKKQGKFWEMHDLLFEKQDEWAKANDVETIFKNYAVLLGISPDQFVVDWKSKEVKDFVRAQKNHATKSGLQGTPTFFLGGKQIQNPASLEAFRSLILAELAKK